MANQGDERPAPERAIDKQEAARHLIHTAIRLIAAREDPFAVHLLIHSADKILIDLAKARGKALRMDWEAHIKPEYHEEFFKRYRETYNYLKHANRDFDDTLGVRDIAMTNAMNLFMCVVNYMDLFGQPTHHMALFQAFTVALMPDIIEPIAVQGIELLKGARDMQGMTPGEFFETFEEHPEALPCYLTEKVQDCSDIGHFYHLTFKELREGKRKSPRIFRLAAY
jgi:hypothetical protein